MLRRIEMWLLDLAVAAVIALGLLITVTVVLRVTMNSGVPDTIVMVRELMVAAVLAEQGVAAHCTNVAEGFEGDLDQGGHRGGLGGWKARGLPWRQN